ncbi:MAG: hypothetical protein K9L30_07575 [Desulfobacterales bacterium]|nr:hypothetical protein [Desulfobacterales bacterium]
MNKDFDRFQVIWGVALIVMGVAMIVSVIIQHPVVMQKIEGEIWKYFCYLFISIILSGAGGKKLYDQLWKK